MGQDRSACVAGRCEVCGVLASGAVQGRVLGMPTYEYKCLSCERRFEVFQSMSDRPLTECSECRGPVKRLIGKGAGLLFKGSGFYVTDYRSESYRQAEKRAASDTGTSTATASPKAGPSATGTAPSSSGSAGATEKKKP